MIPDITKEELIRKYAHQRWEIRNHFNWKMNETADDDWKAAEEIVNREEHLYGFKDAERI